MKTEDWVTFGVVGLVIYAVLVEGFKKAAVAATTAAPGTSPIPLPGGVNPINLNVDFGEAPGATWDGP